jgi:tetratricopeptide (TPR) repeat protein
VDPDASKQSEEAAFSLGGRVELAGADLHLTAELQDARDHMVLWSTTFTRPTGQMQAMQEQVSANLAAVLHCALDTSRQRHGGLDRDTIKLYLKACALQQSVDPPEDEIIDLLKQVTARQPRFATGWARLALATAEARFVASPANAEALRRDASAAAQTALRLDPKAGLAYEALTNMELGRVPFAQLHREFRKTLSLDPNNADVINDDGELVMRMGSLDQGLQMFRRGVELDPLSPAQVSDLIKGLIDDSRDNEAQATLHRALRIWPDDDMLRVVHLAYEARFGDPETALAILKDPDARPHKVHDITLEAYRRLAETRKSAGPAQTRAFIAWLKQSVASGNLGVDFAAPEMAQFGDVDGAFKLAMAGTVDVPVIDPEFLWEPEALPLRRDPRFVALAAKFHVADFWTSTGMWPDFCATPNWPYNCKTEISLLASARVGSQPSQTRFS